MKFNKVVYPDPNQERFPSPKYDDVHWYSMDGRYKISVYDNPNSTRIDFRMLPGGFYAAYYKPKGWKNFGNHVDKGTPYYRTLTEAKAACERFDKVRTPDQ